MGGRNYVPPPDSALAPNVAPGREFWMDWEGADAGQPQPPPIPPAIVDPTLPNATRISIAEQLYSRFLGQGFDEATARSMADARALQMIP